MNMKKVFLPALGLAAALAFSPIAGVSAADAAPVHHKHHVMHHKHHVVHHKHKTVHHKHHVVHHKHKKA